MESLAQTPIEVWPAGRDDVFAAARLKAGFKMSFADAFAAATAMGLNAALVTGDPELRALEDAGLVRLEWVGAVG